jgi:thymidylate kinase
VPPELGAERRSGRAADRIESKGDDYLDRVFRGFQKEAKRHRARYTLIDGSGAVQDVRKKIWDEVEPLLGT